MIVISICSVFPTTFPSTSDSTNAAPAAVTVACSVIVGATAVDFPAVIHPFAGAVPFTLAIAAWLLLVENWGLLRVQVPQYAHTTLHVSLSLKDFKEEVVAVLTWL